MTMIGFATYGDHAEIITDSASYSLNGAALGSCTKHITFPHMDAAVLTQGNSRFGSEAKSVLLQVSAWEASFDQLADATAMHLRNIWSALADADQEPKSDAAVFLIGYSTAAEKFVALGFASDRDNFEPFKITGPWLMPMPWGHKPTTLEMARFRIWQKGRQATLTDVPEDVDRLDAELRQEWAAKPALTALHGAEDWKGAAMVVRRSRALQGYANVYVAGKVIHTRMERGRIETATIHEFDDSGDEFLKMIEGTQHPIAQLMECWCESGKTAIDCHLAEQLDQPCGCKSDKAFAECCAVGASLNAQ